MNLFSSTSIGLVLWWTMLAAVFQESKGSLAEQHLLANLTLNYRHDVRPVINVSTPVTITMDIAINQIVDMDEKNQILKTMCWMRLYWYDEYMRWNPDDYAGLKSIRLSPKSVWKPDITLYNDVGETGMTPMLEYNINFYSDGYAAWLSPIALTSACKLDMAQFPHDTQYCNLTFGSWAFHGFDVDLVNRTASGDAATFTSNGEWNIDAFPVNRKVTYYNCCPEPYPVLTYTLVLNRRPLYYIFNLLLPCVVIIAITTMGFLLPTDSGEKVSLMITCMLSITVFLLLVAETMPANSESVPWIGVFFASSIILVALSTVICVLIITAHYSGSHGRRIPPLLKRFVFSVVARLVFKHKLVTDLGLVTDKKVHAEPENKPSLSLGSTQWAEKIANGVPKSENLSRVEVDESSPLLLGIYKAVHQLRAAAEAKEEEDSIASEWQMMAIILDQLFFMIFVLVTIILAIYIFSYTPSR